MKYLILKTLKGDRTGNTTIIRAKNSSEARKKANDGNGRIKSITCLDSNLKGGE